jgi:hypothetical protein
VKVELGVLKGSEVPIDPTELLPHWSPTVSLAEGIAAVIADARAYLDKDQTVAAGLAD